MIKDPALNELFGLLTKFLIIAYTIKILIYFPAVGIFLIILYLLLRRRHAA